MCHLCTSRPSLHSSTTLDRHSAFTQHVQVFGGAINHAIRWVQWRGWVAAGVALGPARLGWVAEAVALGPALLSWWAEAAVCRQALARRLTARAAGAGRTPCQGNTCSPKLTSWLANSLLPRMAAPRRLQVHGAHCAHRLPVSRQPPRQRGRRRGRGLDGHARPPAPLLCLPQPEDGPRQGHLSGFEEVWHDPG